MSTTPYTDRSRRVLARAAEEADKDRTHQIGTHHLLLAILGSGGVADEILKHHNITREKVEAAIDATTLAEITGAQFAEVMNSLDRNKSPAGEGQDASPAGGGSSAPEGADTREEPEQITAIEGITYDPQRLSILDKSGKVIVKGIDPQAAPFVIDMIKQSTSNWSYAFSALAEAKRIVTCVYCGHEYPAGTKPSREEALNDHILNHCPKHPLAKAVKTLRSISDDGNDLAKRTLTEIGANV